VSESDQNGKPSALLLASNDRDASMARDVLLESGLRVVSCRTIKELYERINDRIDLAVIAHDDLAADSGTQLRAEQTDLPEWMNVPLIIMPSRVTPDRHSWEWLVGGEGPVQPIVLEYPIQRDALSRAVQSSIRSRAGQQDIHAEMRHRREIEAELRLSRRRYVDLVEGVDAIVYERNPSNLRFTFVSQQAVSLLGYPLSCWLTDPSFWLETIVHEDDRKNTQAAVNQACKEGRSAQLEYRARRADGEILWLRDFVRVGSRSADRVDTLSGLIVDITERKKYERQLRLLMRELNHRVRNTLATVQAMALQTIRNCETLEQFRDSFQSRLRSMAQAHSLLSQREWRSVKLRKLLGMELSAHVASSKNIQIEGPKVALRPKAALALHMVIHELCTNAAKYGALSVPDGRVAVN
jgi:PAS domain S-box-containing protein